MKRYFVYIKTILFLVIVGVVFGFTSRRNDLRTIQSDVNIQFGNEDNLFLTHSMVNNLLIQNGEHVVNQAKTLINLQSLEHQVQEHPMVSSAQVSVGITGDLEVSVKQRKPLARLYNPKGVVYLDVEGVEMPLSTNYSARVLVVDNRQGLMDNKEIFPLIKKVNSDEFLKELIVLIKKDTEGYWFQTRYNKQEILFGDLKQINQKLKKIKVFYSYIEKDKLSETFKKIDVQYNNQVVCLK